MVVLILKIMRSILMPKTKSKTRIPSVFVYQKPRICLDLNLFIVGSC